ncbi:Protein mono-ADP-ribosyltransferase PARP3 [Lamellibrachia satsuma]|nr:Protein mono-ADP-ribosyltransferase PARP3 [Lamellibrachia satsuma]
MPPKRKAAAIKKAAGGKKKKISKPAATPKTTLKDTVAALKKADEGKTRKAKPDPYCPMADDCEVYEDYDCMLNQTNIGQNNNKFYVIQILEDESGFNVFTRWGRVGEQGAQALRDNCDKDQAIAEFKKKFKDKTKNKWEDRANFVPSPGKYTLLEMDEEEEVEEGETESKQVDVVDGLKMKVAVSTLGKETQSLVKLIFDNDMFSDAMKNMDIDTKKMPLGKLSKSQIAKGFEVLDELESAIKKKKTAGLMELSSQFYTIIPHNFGRQRPPIMSTLETVRQKLDMLQVLGDIELALSMQKDKKTTKKKLMEKEVPNPLDVNYDLLLCDLELVDTKSDEYKILNKYVMATQGGYKSKILDVWKVNRQGEDQRFAEYKAKGNRKLLWHGTNVAVVAAILKSGLRIMPHSGGRVGRGIYFASENSKSAGYVGRTSKGIGIMFLNEVVLGKENHITVDDSSLVAPPSGYDSVVAKGHTEPDPKKTAKLLYDGNEVVVPQGTPVKQNQFSKSHFSQSEYLIYRENQCRIRYLLKLQF